MSGSIRRSLLVAGCVALVPTMLGACSSSSSTPGDAGGGGGTSSSHSTSGRSSSDHSSESSKSSKKTSSSSASSSSSKSSASSKKAEKDGGARDGGAKEGGAERDAGPLVPCNCDPSQPVNMNKPVCGCLGLNPDTFGSGPTLASMGNGATYTSGYLDTPNDRLVLGVSSVGGSSADKGGALWTVDVKTGNRAVLSGFDDNPSTGVTSVGTGPAMLDVVAVQGGPGGLYVYERHGSGGGVAEIIQRVDPTTGNRTTLLDVPTDPLKCTTSGTAVSTPSLNPVPGIAVDENDALYFATTSPSYVSLVKVTFADGGKPTCSVVTGDDGTSTTGKVGSGPLIQDFSSLVYASGKVWVFDFVTQALFQIDPSTGARVIVSSPAAGAMVGTDGDPSDPCFPDTPSPNAWAIGSVRAWGTASSMSDSLLTSVTLATGNRACTRIPFANIDTSVGVFITPEVILAVGATSVWAIDTSRNDANVLSE